MYTKTRNQGSSDPDPSDPDALSHSNFSNLLSSEGRKEMFQEACDDNIDLLIKKVASSTRRNHYMCCMRTRIIADSLKCLNDMLARRKRTKHQQAIGAFMEEKSVREMRT